MISNIPSLSKKQAQAIVAILAGCLLFGFILSYSYTKLTLPKAVSPKTAVVKRAELTLSTDKNEVRTGEKLFVTIGMDTYNQGVEAADFVVTFDPLYLKPVKLTEGKFFKLYPVKKVEEDFVKVSGMASLEGNTIYISKGKGPVALIVFQAEKETEGTEIVFDRVKTVIASSGKNILGKTEGVKVRIN